MGITEGRTYGRRTDGRYLYYLCWLAPSVRMKYSRSGKFAFVCFSAIHFTLRRRGLASQFRAGCLLLSIALCSFVEGGSREEKLFLLPPSLPPRNDRAKSSPVIVV